MTPVVATVVRSEARPQEWMARLNSHEREYVHRTLKRKDRTYLTQLLSGKRSREDGTAPLRIQVLRSGLPEKVRLQIFEELRGNVCDKYVQWVRRALRLPLDRVFVVPQPYSPAECVAKAKAIMDSAVAGHAAAKCEVLKMLCQSKCGSDGAGAYSLGLEGPPGTGKTHFVKNALAPALGRPMVEIPLGGATDIAFLLGNVYTYEGSKEGRLAAALMEAECCNPILYFDEVDKVSQTDRGQEIVSALIHLVDVTANAALRDRYFHGIDLNFSRCTFVFSYNDPSKVSPILLDRIKRVAMPVPSLTERETIVRDHLVPRVQSRLNTALALSEAAVESVLLEAGGGVATGGMRGAERDVDHVLGAAQLCAACDDSNDGLLAGLSGVKVLDETGAVSGTFASECLRALHRPEGGGAARTGPPAGMYT